jgi:hypothetical protein|tara:strand:- start:377 stop:493 length:117 start_codon:yes stop_codon:yes gene_type:complete
LLVEQVVEFSTVEVAVLAAIVPQLVVKILEVEHLPWAE